MFYKNSYINSILVCTIVINRATINEANEFKNMLDSEILLKRERVIIDLTQCDYIDSTFIGVLVYSLKSVSHYGGEIKLVNLKSEQNAIFYLNRMNRIFDSYLSVKEAIYNFDNSIN